MFDLSWSRIRKRIKPRRRLTREDKLWIVLFVLMIASAFVLTHC